MNPLTINTLKKSQHFGTIALTLATLLFVAPTSHAQQLQKGVSVQLAATTNAAAMPAADNQDAWIVAVTSNGSFFFGTDKVTPSALSETMKRLPRNRDQRLYIKADARAPFSDVERVVAAGHEVAFGAAVFLTSQPESPAPGTVVSPKGLDVMVDPPSAKDSPVIQVVNSGQQGPTLMIGGHLIPSDSLQSTLRDIFQNRTEKVVLVKADGALPFADIVRVIDTCRSAGVKIALLTPGL
jgi:biopolymer transport protein ExbD